MKKIQITKKGFSLVEVLVSLTVLSIGIVTITMLMTVNIKTSTVAKNQVVAAELAQEGIELVRNVRDNGSAAFVAKADGDYLIDYTTNLTSLGSSNGRLFLKDGFYSHTSTSAVATKFYRKITLSVSGSNKVVNSMVNWDPAGVFPSPCNLGNKCISTVSYMPN